MMGVLAAFVATAAAGQLELEIAAADFDLSADTERAVTRILTRMYGTYEAWFGLALPPRLHLPVTLVDAEATYRAREREILGQPGHTVGFFDGRTGAATVWHGRGDAEMRATLVHETSHHLLAVAGLARVPAWVNEGLAELFETAMLDGNAVWLVPNPDMVQYLDGRSRPPATALVGLDAATWRGLGATPWTRPEYPYGWELCAFFASTEAGRRALADVALSTATAPSVEAGSAASAAIDRSYPGGRSGLDRDFAAWRPSRLQLPIRTDTGQASGWAKCADGTLVRVDAGATCGRWVPGPDGLLRYVEEKPVP